MTDPENIDEAYERHLLAQELDMAREDVKLAAEAREQATAAYHRAVDRFIQADHAYDQSTGRVDKRTNDSGRVPQWVDPTVLSPMPSEYKRTHD